MKLCFADESKVDGNSASIRSYGVCIYGGLLLNEVTFRELTDFLYGLKENIYPQELEIKWSFAETWKNMKKVGYLPEGVNKKQDNPELYDSLQKDHELFKERILNRVGESDSSIIIVMRPEGLLRTRRQQQITYPLEALCKKVEMILAAKNEYGILLADELPSQLEGESVRFKYILDICAVGVQGNKLRNLISIIPTISSHISPIHQINDIVLGVVQFYILNFIRKLDNEDLDISDSINLMKKIKGNFHYHIYNGRRMIINSGILTYPPRNSRAGTSAGVFLNKFEKQLEVELGII